MKKAEKAFTLVELLVVISIIAILLAVLMPALAKVKEQGRTVVCATNLKNYGLAFGMYASANSDRFPDKYWLYSYNLTENPPYPYGGKGKCSSSGCRWHYDGDTPDGSLWPYLRDKNINLCPTFRNFAQAGGLAICPYGPHSSDTIFHPAFSYVSNNSLWTNWPVGGWKSMKISDVRRPSLCAAFSEANLWTISGTTVTRYNHPRRTGDGNQDYSTTCLGNTDLWLSAQRGSADDNIATYHKVGTAKCDYGVANIVYVDGHVKAVKGLAGYNAYLEYGRPYYGHEKIAPH